MKYLITGGAGFLGSNLSKRALDNGDSVVIIDNLSRTGSEANLKWLSESGDLTFYNCDIRDFDKIRSIIKEHKPQVIFHLAGQVAMTKSLEDPISDFQTNALGTLNLLEATRLFSPDSTVIYSSTNKVYGDLKKYHYKENDTRYICEEYPNGFDEGLPLYFSTPYGCSKGSADQYIIDYFKTYGLKTIAFRHSSMYGGRQFATYDQGWIGWFVRKALDIYKGDYPKNLTVSGTGKQVRDILHINDVVDLYFKSANMIDEIAGNAFNIGGGIDNSISIIELFKYLESNLKITIDYSNIKERINDQRVYISNIGKANRFISWRPEIPLKEGLRKMITWTKDLVDENNSHQKKKSSR